MDEDEFARALLAHERKEWQDPESILDQLNLSAGITVADLGCGPGFFTIPIAKRIQPKGIVYAVDSSDLMLDYLRSHAQRSKVNAATIKITKADVSETRIPPLSADVVIFANILHDLDDKMKFLNEVLRISKSNSAIIDIDWHAKETPVGPPPEIRLAESKARAILEEAGLKLRKFNAGPYHYGFVCKRG